MKIILTSVDDALADAWERFCGELDFVHIHRGPIQALKCDAIVSPANSFGFMDGGIDLIYCQYFGWHLQERLQKLIATNHHGELLVGTAEIVETDDASIPYMIASPTMRVPMILGNTVNPYLAARAVLLLVKYGAFTHGKHIGEAISNHIRTIAFPGLGTGVGRVGPNTCAHQMRTSIDDILLEKRTIPASWAEAQARHQKLYTDRIRDLQHE